VKTSAKKNHQLFQLIYQPKVLYFSRLKKIKYINLHSHLISFYELYTRANKFRTTPNIKQNALEKYKYSSHKKTKQKLSMTILW